MDCYQQNSLRTSCNNYFCVGCLILLKIMTFQARTFNLMHPSLNNVCQKFCEYYPYILYRVECLKRSLTRVESKICQQILGQGESGQQGQTHWLTTALMTILKGLQLRPFEDATTLSMTTFGIMTLGVSAKLSLTTI